MSIMRAQPRLLNALVDYWHPDAEAFMIEGQSLTPTTEDIYFLTGLSRRGEPVNLCTFPPGPFNIVDYIGMHCEVGTEKVGSQVPINKITNLSLKVILLLIGRITGSADHTPGFPGAHVLCMQCLDAHIFDWSTTMLDLHEEATYRVSSIATRTSGSVPFCARSSLRGYPVLSPERQYGGMWPPSQRCVDGKHCCHE
jgi:hypothetical protein